MKIGSAEQKLFLVGDNHNIPACYENREGKIVGIDVDIVREVMRRNDLEVVIKLLPWKRVIAMLKNGDAHGGFPFFITPERQEYLLYTETPVHRVNMMVYVRPGNEFEFKEISDLHGRVVGINRGYSISSEFDSSVKDGKIRLREINEADQLVKMLLIGRFDVIVAKQSEVQAFLYKANLELSSLGSLTEGKGSFFVLSKTSSLQKKEDLLKRINHTMSEMKADGTIEKITKSYVTKPF